MKKTKQKTQQQEKKILTIPLQDGKQHEKTHVSAPGISNNKVHSSGCASSSSLNGDSHFIVPKVQMKNRLMIHGLEFDDFPELSVLSGAGCCFCQAGRLWSGS